MIKQLSVTLTNKQKHVIFTLAKSVGVNVHSGTYRPTYRPVTDVDALVKEYETWPYLTINEYGISACRYTNATDVITHADFLLAIAEFKSDVTFDIKLNESHVAAVNVTKGVITVGCQTFELARIKELVEKANKLS